VSSYYYAKKREAEPTARETRDAVLKEKIMEVWKDRKNGREVYGVRKVWLALNQQGTEVARCTVERLMRELGIGGVRSRRETRRRGRLTCWSGASARRRRTGAGWRISRT
jgi:putative transposase